MTRKKWPNVYKSCPKIISQEKKKDFYNFTKNWLKCLGKIIVATGFEKLPKVQYIAQSGHTVEPHPNPTLADLFWTDKKIMISNCFSIVQAFWEGFWLFVFQRKIKVVRLRLSKTCFASIRVMESSIKFTSNQCDHNWRNFATLVKI